MGGASSLYFINFLFQWFSSQCSELSLLYKIGIKADFKVKPYFLIFDSMVHTTGTH